MSGPQQTNGGVVCILVDESGLARQVAVVVAVVEEEVVVEEASSKQAEVKR